MPAMPTSPPPYPEPTAHRVDLLTGALGNASGQYKKTLRDMRGVYADEQAYQAACARGADAVVYEVTDQKPPAARAGDLIFGVTRMQPGRIGEEFYVTRGHAIANRPETYYGEQGHGLLLMESPAGDIRILEMLPRVMCYVPPFWIHRSVNIGPEPFIMSFCYPADSGQDYDIIARSGGMRSRIVRAGDGWREVPNPAFRPRTQAEIDAILATSA
jgi:glucose-6-phosphate isomerase